MRSFIIFYCFLLSGEQMEQMVEIDAIYENGVLRVIKPEKIQSNIVRVKILNRDEILTEEDMRDVLEAMSEREKGKCYTLKEVFE